MDVATFYVGQGELVGIRVGTEGIVIDAHMPNCEDVSSEEIQQSLKSYFKNSRVRGLVLTGLDSDHAHPDGVDWILTHLRPEWVMYPKYYKDTDSAADVFAHIERHVRQRAGTASPLVRHSMRLDRLDSREIKGLGANFSFELFSPHIEDMDCSNNCSIVAKITGHDATGFRYLVTGDTEVDRWITISDLFGTDLASDVMSAPHHGAASGVHVKTLIDVQPNTILISAGVDNQYDHPSPGAVAAFCRVAKHVHQTNAGDEPHCLFTRRAVANGDFETRAFRHEVAQAA